MYNVNYYDGSIASQIVRFITRKEDENLGDYKGNGGLTREQFLYHETKTVARLMTDESLSDDEIVKRVVEEKICFSFQQSE